MKAPLTVILTIAALLPLSACSMLDKMTKQTDDTVLPGPREDAVPGRTQYPAQGEQPAKTTTATTAEAPADAQATDAQSADAQATDEKKPCAADDPECLPPLTDGDTFSDGQ